MISGVRRELQKRVPGILDIQIDKEDPSARKEALTAAFPSWQAIAEFKHFLDEEGISALCQARLHRCHREKVPSSMIPGRIELLTTEEEKAKWHLVLANKFSVVEPRDSEISGEGGERVFYLFPTEDAYRTCFKEFRKKIEKEQGGVELCDSRMPEEFSADPAMLEQFPFGFYIFRWWR